MTTNTLNRRLLLGAATTLAVTTLVLAGCTTTQTVGDKSTQPQAITVPDGDGPGITATTINLLWSGTATSSGDPKADADNLAAMKAVVAQLNKQGGIAGRQVVIPDVNPVAGLTKQRQDAQKLSAGLGAASKAADEETCAAFDKASPFFAHLGEDLFTDPFGGAGAAVCLNKTGHVIVGAPSSWSKSDFEAAPFTAGIGIGADRMIDAYVAAANDAGLDKDGPLAVIADAAVPQEKTQAYAAALTKAGFKKATLTTVAGDISPADATNLVVKLRSAGTASIVYTNIGPGALTIAGTMIEALSGQQFSPKQVSIDPVELGPWIPLTPELNASLRFYSSKRNYFQPTPEQEAATKTTPGGALCAAVGETAPELKQKVNADFCDGLALLKAALEAGDKSKGLNANTFKTGIAALKDSFVAQNSFAVKFSDKQHDGISGFVSSTYDPAEGTTVLGTKVVTF